MIPYYELPSVSLGPVVFPLFPALIVAGLVVGYGVFLRRVERSGRPLGPAQWFFVSAVMSGFVGAHIAKLAIYESEPLLGDLPRLVSVFSGLASFGGFAGAIAGAWIFKRMNGVSNADIAFYADAAVYASPFGWTLGRAACAFTHDHVGRRSGHWLAVAYPDGARWNLGLVEMIWVALIALAFLWLGRRPRPVGFYPAAFCFLYGPFRFWLDGLHEGAGGWMTPDRLGALGVLACGCMALAYAAAFKGVHDDSTEF